MKYGLLDDWIIPATLEASISNEVQKLKSSKAVWYKYTRNSYFFKVLALVFRKFTWLFSAFWYESKK